MLIRRPSTLPTVILLYLLKCANSMNYGYSPYNFVPLANAGVNSESANLQVLRLRRQAAETLNDDINDDLRMEDSTFPPDAERENDNTPTTEHTYYNKTVYTNRADLMDKYYADMLNFTKLANGTLKHEHLNSTYRKAAGVKLTFPFPFYGHRLLNLTIATGGFLYVGDQAHNWLAATQYIAPLMANFDTVSNGAAIMYGDDGERVIVEWSNVTLRDNREAGNFSFQVHLFKNGDIWFVYKDVPISPKNISDTNHPCKLGISDAYLFNHKHPNSDKSATSRRIIHEYHRIAIEAEKVTSNTIVVLTALPTCLDFQTCGECSHANLKSFHCSWCKSDSAEKSFCSDQAGLNRRRQEYVDGFCADEKRESYCDASPNVTAPTAGASTTVAAAESASSTASGTPPTGATAPADAKTTGAPSGEPQGMIPLDDGGKAASAAKDGKDSGGSSGSKDADERGSNLLAFVTLFLVVGVALSVWMLYAYYNPHTTSGQILIKYRPSKWQIPSSHVRYSASVHM